MNRSELVAGSGGHEGLARWSERGHTRLKPRGISRNEQTTLG